MKKRVSFAAVFACLLGAMCLALVGCAGSNQTAGSNDAASGASTDAQGASAYQLTEAGTLIGVSDMAYPPLESIPEGKTDPEGFEIDMMAEVAKRLGLQMKWLDPMKFDTIIPLIKQGGKADVGVSAFTITAERKEEIDFTNSYLDSNQAVVLKKDSAKKGADTSATQANLNASGIKVAVQAGTTGEEWVRENLPTATCVPLDDAIQALTGLTAGTYDAVVADLPVMSYLCTNSYTDCEVAIEIPTGEQYGIVVSKQNTQLTKDINEALAAMATDGTMAKLQQKWFGAAL